MIEGLKRNTSSLALAVAAGLMFSGAYTMPAKAADLGGDCCADLEERISELEVTTVRKGNRKVYVKLYGEVTRAIMMWESSYNDFFDNQQTDSDIYSVGLPVWSSKIGLTGGAKIGHGWSAGFKLEWETGDTLANHVDEDNDQNDLNDDGIDAAGLALRHEVVYLKHDRLGTIATGHSSVSTDGIAEIDLSGTKGVARSDMGLHGAAFWLSEFDDITWGGAFGSDSAMFNLDGGRSDAIVRYDTPTIGGVRLSATYGEDDYWDIALRYMNEFGGQIKVAGGIGYSVLTEGQNGGEVKTLSGSASMLHIPTGLFLTAAAGERDTESAAGVLLANKNYWYLKAGMRQRFTHLGATTVYGEYGNFDTDNNIFGYNVAATGWGLGVVQNIDLAAMDLFATYRSLETDGVDFGGGNVIGADSSFQYFMVGARIKF